jgi:hypothetical protein
MLDWARSDAAKAPGTESNALRTLDLRASGFAVGRLISLISEK